MPHRFFCDKLPVETPRDGLSGEVISRGVQGLRVSLDEDETRHARKALRLDIGSVVELIDGKGTLAQATLESYDKLHAYCRVTCLTHAAPQRPRLTLACAMPKGPRADAMVNDLAQLGVDCFIPLRTARSVVDPRDHKLERLERAAVAAAKQSGRLTLMRVQPTRPLGELLGGGPTSADPALRQASGHGLRLLLDPHQPIQADTVHEQLRRADDVTLLVGPEGGWSDEELLQCEQAGVVRWCLSANVLRVETAAAAAAALVRYLTRPR